MPSDPEGMHQQERTLFFSTERILRWMRWIRGNKDLHPELAAYEQDVMKKNSRWSALRRYARKAYHTNRL